MHIHFLAAGITERPKYPFTKLIRGHVLGRGVAQYIITPITICPWFEDR
jgi:hypothetical protein